MDDRPEFDEGAAKQLIGKRLLVGLTYIRHSGELIEEEQRHGIVETADRQGIVLRLPDGGTFRLPPDLRRVQPARPGIYRLRATGEEVTGPDFLSSWTITRPDA